MTPQFSSFSLRLIHGKEVIFSSDRHGLRPLVECVSRLRGTVAGCTLQDRAIGLAAARIIVFSGMISNVETAVASVPALRLLREGGISVTSEKTVENILNTEKTALCPMEQRALNETDNVAFFNSLDSLFSGKSI